MEYEYFSKHKDPFKKLIKEGSGPMGIIHEESFTSTISDLIGSEIIDIGFHDKVEGGLSFDYIKNGIKKRIIIGYTELGEWIEWEGELK